MRILWDCRSIGPHMGGIARAAAGWLHEFLCQMPDGWNVEALFSASCKPEQAFRVVPGLECAARAHFVEAGMVAPRFEQLALPAILERHRIDLYINPCFTIPAIKTTRVQCSVVHDIVFLDHPEWVDSRLRKYLEHGTDLSLRRADAVFTVSDYSKSRIQQLATARGWDGAAEIRVVRPAISENLLRAASEHARAASAEGGHEKLLLYVGAAERKKGVLTLLDAYVLLRRRLGGNCPLLVVAGGQGGQRFDLQAELQQRRLDSGVEVKGVVTEREKFDLLRRATVFVFPSLYEGFGIPPLEAMAFGTPVVAARSTSLPEVLGDAALFAEPGDAESLAAAIVRALEDTELRSALSVKGQERAARYSWTAEVRKLVARFEELEKAS